VRSNRLTYSWKHKLSLIVLLFLTVSFSVAQQSDTLSHSNIWFNEPFTILPDEAILLIYQMPMDGVIKGLNIPVAKWGTGDQSLTFSLHRTSYPHRNNCSLYPMDVVGSNGWIGGYDMDQTTGEMSLVGTDYSSGGTFSVCTNGADTVADSARDPLGWVRRMGPYSTPTMGLAWPDGFYAPRLDTTRNPDLLSGGGDNWINTYEYGTEPEYDAGDWVGVFVWSWGDGGGDDPATGFQYIHADSIGLNDTWLGLKFYRECSDDSPTGNSGWHILPWVFNVQLAVEYTTVEVESDVRLPTTMHLSQNYPNPFNPITIIQYELPQQSDVQITIYDLVGREVTTLVSEIQDAGYKSIQWNATNVPSGIYFYQIRAGEFVQTRKMVLLK